MDLQSTEVEHAIRLTQTWLERIVIGLNLCPFAKSVYNKQQIRYVVSSAQSCEALLDNLQEELRFLAEQDPQTIDTTLLIHPYVLNDFLNYNDFLDDADQLLEKLGFLGTLQVASFHPNYQFAGVAADDITNYSNRSPFPMLHILREASIDKAVVVFPDAEMITQKNIEALQQLGFSKLNTLLAFAQRK
jgi:hypothetical protein